MVQVEHGVAGGGKDVAAGVAADGEMSAGVHAEEACGEVALHGGLEGGDVGGLGDEGGGVGVGVGLGGDEDGDVAFAARRVSMGWRRGGDVGGAPEGRGLKSSRRACLRCLMLETEQLWSSHVGNLGLGWDLRHTGSASYQRSHR